MLDYKFNAGTRIADINDPKEYFSIQTLITSTFIKTEAIKDTRFDTRIICGEDTIFCNLIMLEKCKIGYLKEALYYYRQRAAKDSTVDKIKRNIFYYDGMLEYYYNGMISYSKEKFGKVIPYLQAIMTNDLMWHFEACETHEVLSDEEFVIYKQRVKEILSYIDDDIIFGHPLHKAYTRRSAAVNFKYDIDYYKALTLKENKLFFRKYSVFNMVCRNTLCMLNSMGADKNKFRIEVLVANWILRATGNGGRFVFKVGDRFVKPKEVLEYAPKTAKTFDGGEYYYSSFIFNLKLKLKEGEDVTITPYIIYGEEVAPIYINCTKAKQGVNPFTTCLVQGKYSVSYADDAIKISRK